MGDMTSYYPNGKAYTIETYDNRKMFLKECRDSTGKVLCQNGNGSWIKYDADFQNSSTGNVVNGIETGEWKGMVGDSINYTCMYKKGDIVSGIGYYKGGKANPFKKVEVEPDFGQGLDNFISFLHRKIIYPEYAKEHKLSGQVVVSFEIEKDGTIDDVKILQGSALSFKLCSN